MDINKLMTVIVIGFCFGWMINHATIRRFSKQKTFWYGAGAYALMSLLVMNVLDTGAPPPPPGIQALVTIAAAAFGGFILIVLVNFARRKADEVAARTGVQAAMPASQKSSAPSASSPSSASSASSASSQDRS